MPVHQVFFSSQVRKDLKRIGAAAAKRVLKQIAKKLTEKPEDYGEELHADLKGYYKLRVDDCRVVYKIIEERVWVLILAVGKRAEGDFENIYHWLTKERADRRFGELLREIEREHEEEAEAVD